MGKSKALLIADEIRRPRFLYAVLCIAFLVRCSTLLIPITQSSDFDWYFQRALALLRGEGYSEDGVLTAFWPVGWPGTLAGLFAVFGPFQEVGQIANLLMSLCSCYLTARLAYRACGSPGAANLAALLIAVYPNQIGYVPLLSTELFFELLLLLGVYLFTSQGRVQVILAGVIFGFGVLTKTQAVLVPIFISLGWLLSKPTWIGLSNLGKRLSIVFAVIAFVVAPWTIRNWHVFHAFVLVSTNGGWTLITGNNSEAKGDYTPDTVLAAGISHDPRNQIAAELEAKRRTYQWISNHPQELVMLLPLKLFRLWAPDGESEWFYQRGFERYGQNVFLFRVARVINQVFYVSLLLLSAFAIAKVVLRRERNGIMLVSVTLIFYTSLISLVFSGQSRLHFAVMPFIIILAVATLRDAFRVMILGTARASEPV